MVVGVAGSLLLTFGFVNSLFDLCFPRLACYYVALRARVITAVCKGAIEVTNLKGCCSITYLSQCSLYTWFNLKQILV